MRITRSDKKERKIKKETISSSRRQMGFEQACWGKSFKKLRNLFYMICSLSCSLLYELRTMKFDIKIKGGESLQASYSDTIVSTRSVFLSDSSISNYFLCIIAQQPVPTSPYSPFSTSASISTYLPLFSSFVANASFVPSL